MKQIILKEDDCLRELSAHFYLRKPDTLRNRIYKDVYFPTELKNPAQKYCRKECTVVSFCSNKCEHHSNTHHNQALEGNFPSSSKTQV